MSGISRVTVTLPSEILVEIDRGDRNRSRFILEAVQREIARRKLEALELSLRHPHPDSLALESMGLQEWFDAGNQDAAELVDLNGGNEIHWVPDQGWVQGKA